MKKLTLLIFLCFTIGAFCQNSNIDITYKVNLVESDVPDALKDIYKIAYENVKYIDFKLLGTAKESLFYREKLLTNEAEKGTDIALTILGAKGNYYTDFSKNIVLEDRPAYGERFVIQHPILNSEWKMTKESKKIGKYQCYKATTTYVVNNGKRFEFPVTAWYAPEINLSFGPKNYSGLPGLILELHEKDRIFYADKISLGQLHVKQLKLIAPPKGKKPITQAEFDAIGAKIAKERFGGR